MSVRALVHASDGEVAAAGDALLKKGNAVDAVIAGVFAACALHKGTLLSPVQILVGGAGAGLRAVDGRLRQPGMGVPRPRGFRENDPIPPAARVAVPTIPAVLAGAAAALGTATLTQLVGPAVEMAKSRDAQRGAVLHRILERGGAAFSDASLSEELVVSLGRLAGGVVTAVDLDAVRPDIVACAVDIRGARRFARAPWAAETENATRSGRAVRAVVASDVHGTVAIALYEAPDDGLTIDALGLLAPFHAAPVLRGETRIAPGTVRPAASPAFLSETAGLLDVALSICASASPEPDLEAIMAQLTEAPLVTAPEDATVPGYYVGITRSRSTVQVVSDPRRSQTVSL